MIILKPGIRCKCSNQHYKDTSGKNYWYNEKTKILYETDPHVNKNPKKYIGNFKIEENEYKKNKN